MNCYYKKCKAKGTHDINSHTYCLRHYKKKLKEALDDVWRRLVYQRGYFKCEVCNKSNCQLNAHHIEGRSPQTLRWNIDNGICLCVGHHTFYNISAHSPSSSGQRKFREHLLDLRGLSLLEKLEDVRGKGVVKYSLAELEDIYLDLEGQIIE